MNITKEQIIWVGLIVGVASVAGGLLGMGVIGDVQNLQIEGPFEITSAELIKGSGGVAVVSINMRNTGDVGLQIQSPIKVDNNTATFSPRPVIAAGKTLSVSYSVLNTSDYKQGDSYPVIVEVTIDDNGDGTYANDETKSSDSIGAFVTSGF